MMPCAIDMRALCLTNRLTKVFKVNLITVGPRVSFDYADVSVDPTPPVCDTKCHRVTDQWVPLVRFDPGQPVDSLTQ